MVTEEIRELCAGGVTLTCEVGTAGQNMQEVEKNSAMTVKADWETRIDKAKWRKSEREMHDRTPFSVEQSIINNPRQGKPDRGLNHGQP